MGRCYGGKLGRTLAIEFRTSRGTVALRYGTNHYTPSALNYCNVRPSSFLWLSLLLVVLLAGCTAWPIGDQQPQERPIFINMTNGVNSSQTLELWIGEGTLLSNITVHRSTGGDYNTTEGRAGISTSDPGDYHDVTSLTFPDDAYLYGRYTLEPGATRTWTMAEPYARTVFVVVVYDGDRVTVWKSVSCDDVLYGFGVRTTSYGAVGSYSC